MRRRMARRAIDRNRRKFLGFVAASAAVATGYALKIDYDSHTVEKPPGKKYIVEMRGVSPLNDINQLMQVDSALDKVDVKKREYLIQPWFEDTREIEDISHRKLNFFGYARANIINKYNIGQDGIMGESYNQSSIDSMMMDMTMSRKIIKNKFNAVPTRFIFDRDGISSKALQAARELYDIAIDWQKVYNRDSARPTIVNVVDYNNVQSAAQNDLYKPPVVIRIDMSQQQNTDKLTQFIKNLELDGYTQTDYNDPMFRQPDSTIERAYNSMANYFLRYPLNLHKY